NKSLITQLEVPTQAPTFAEALRRAALTDANVCAVSDLSSPELLDMACELAESGLLVIGVLRQPDVMAVMEFLMDSLTSRGRRQAAERVVRVLRGIFCQRMCRAKRTEDGTIP